jgi:hypothetical protein
MTRAVFSDESTDILEGHIASIFRIGKYVNQETSKNHAASSRLAHIDPVVSVCWLRYLLRASFCFLVWLTLRP